MEQLIGILMWIALILGLIQVIAQSLHCVHMLQLEGYHGDAYFVWCKEHLASLFPLSRLFLIVSLLVFGIGSIFAGQTFKAVLLIICCIATLIALLGCMPKKAKKPLVFTKRVQRMLLTYAILIAILVLVFEHLGALSSAVWMPLTVLLLVLAVPALVEFANFINAPIEKAVAKHFIKDAERILSEHKNLMVIGITGSYGKTSTKNFLHALLSTQYNTLMTPASFNTTMGVVRAIRENLKPSHEVFICEMGAKGVGEIKEICDIVHPQYGILTSIGEQHLETFLSLENIIKTKFELADAIPSDGFVCLNTDNPYIAGRPVSNTRSVSYGCEQASYHAENVEVSATGCKFTLVEPDGSRTDFTTKLLGAHNIQNIVGCLAMARELGISAEKLVYPVRLLKPVSHRLELLPNGFIDDAFNSNPAGFRSALDVLKGFEGQRVLVTPGMVELGEREAPLNEELGRYAADCCDYAVLVGEKQAPPLKKGLLSAGYDESRIYVAKSLDDGLKFVASLPNEGKRTVLLENDLPDNYN